MRAWLLLAALALALLAPSVAAAGPDKNYCQAEGNAFWTCKIAWGFCVVWFLFWIGLAFAIKGKG